VTLPRFQNDDALAAHQLDRLRELFDAVLPTNAFYRERFEEAGVSSAPRSLGEFLRDVPFTRKADLVRAQHEHPPYGTNLTYPLERYSRLHQTSSTTGRPLRWLDTPESWSWMLDGWQEVLEAAGVTSNDRVFVAFSFAPFIGLWMAFDAAARMGCLTIPGGAMNSATRITAICANEVTTLCCTPTYAIRLGEVAREEGVDLAAASVRRIVVGGEPGASVPATRERIERLWPGARLFDHYGMTEVGPVTFQCPARTDVVHALEQNYLVEVVELQSDAPVEPGSGKTGELVLTTLGRTGSPAIRYRTGDLVRPVARETCACGRRTLAFEGGIIGRADDMVFIRGVNLYPSAVDQVVRSCGGVAEYRVEVDTSPALAELEVLIEPEAGVDGQEACRRLERAFRDAWNLRVPVTEAPPGELPRFELKARRWIRKPA
jgi:phenylacetate-CoA ligase